MQTFKVAFIPIAMQILLGMGGAVQAQTSTASFGVAILLRTFSDTVTADHRCTQSGQSGGRTGTLRISCPNTVDVQAIARASTGKTGQNYRKNDELGQPNRSDIMVVADKPMNSIDPIELIISW
jgi:hypothetical protein